MNKQTNPPLYFYIFMAFTIGLFFYFGWCGFMNLQPFTHETTKGMENNICGNELQIKGYCCKSQAQFESGDCTK